MSFVNLAAAVAAGAIERIVGDFVVYKNIGGEIELTSDLIIPAGQQVRLDGNFYMPNIIVNGSFVMGDPEGLVDTKIRAGLTAFGNATIAITNTARFSPMWDFSLNGNAALVNLGKIIDEYVADYSDADDDIHGDDLNEWAPLHMRDDSRFINRGISEFSMHLHDRSTFHLVDGRLTLFVNGYDNALFIHDGGACTSDFTVEGNFTITGALIPVESSTEDDMSEEENSSSEDEHDSYGPGGLADVVPNILGETGGD